MDPCSFESGSVLENREKREPITIAIIETWSTKLSFKTKPQRKRIIR